MSHGLEDLYKKEAEQYRSSMKTQVGGTHYTKHNIQPIDYILHNNLGFCEGNVVKYITRYNDKNGLEDLLKAKHYVEFLIEREENKKGNN